MLSNILIKIYFSVFEQHIRNLEAEYIQEREQIKKRNKRQQRKNRDNFLVILYHITNLFHMILRFNVKIYY